MDSVEVDDKQMTDQPPETEKQVLSGYQRKCIEKQLLQLRAPLLNTTSLLYTDHSTGFTSDVVKQVVENCETIFTAEDVLQKTDVLDLILAQSVIDIVGMEANPDILVQKLNSTTVKLSSLLVKLNLHNPKMYLG